jgi:hypothetical protein
MNSFNIYTIVDCSVYVELRKKIESQLGISIIKSISNNVILLIGNSNLTTLSSNIKRAANNKINEYREYTG